MNIQNKKSYTQGFSLIELMVVVAIIGILATIAVPNFQKFQARSKQTNAKAELSSIYTAQKSFYAEYSTYSAWLNIIGFVPEGINQEHATYEPLPGVRRFYGTSAGNPIPGDITNLTQSLQLAAPTNHTRYPGAYRAASNLCAYAFTASNVYATVGSTDVTIQITPNQHLFTAQAIGCPVNANANATSSPAADAWYITEARVMRNHRSGL